jgi:hypothetical protein
MVLRGACSDFCVLGAKGGGVGVGVGRHEVW